MRRRKPLTKKQIILLLVLLALGLAAVITGITLLLRQRAISELFEVRTTGDAVAVMTTPVTIYDGMWDPGRYSDELYYPIGITHDGENLIIADTMCDRITIIDSNRSWRVGMPGQYGLAYYDSGAYIDGYREHAMFMKPSDVALAPNGEYIVADTGNNSIRKIDAEFVTTIAGSGEAGYQNGKEGEARFNAPRSVVVDTDGTIYVADTMNHVIRSIDTEGVATLFAGIPGQAGYADGAADTAQFFEPSGLALTPSGALIIADSANHAIRKIENGNVTTIVGTPGENLDFETGYTDGGYINGSNANVRFNFPRDVALMPDGRIVVADSMNHAIRLVDGNSTITLVGNGEGEGYHLSSENLRMTRPEGVFTDGETLYISDTVNNRVLGIPLTERLLAGRPTREEMLAKTDISTDSTFAYNSVIRIYVDGERIDMGKVPPWNTISQIFVPLRAYFEALGAEFVLDNDTREVTITLGGQTTQLTIDRDYFILRGVAVTTVEEIMRLFPHTVEWFPEFSLIVVSTPDDMTEGTQ